jgi:DNA (cytosine-5)-methyltransferase 1
MNGMALCAGVAGLELALHLLTDEYETVCFVERDAYAAAALVARMEDSILGQALIWDDIQSFHGRPWRGLVDCITAGYPCQPFSHAGKRSGADDERHLWPYIRRAIGEVLPYLVVLENVPGHLSLGFDVVRADLQRMGYRVAAGLVSAAEVGAPHERLRLYVVAIREGRRLSELWESSARRERFADGNGSQLVDTGGRGLNTRCTAESGDTRSAVQEIGWRDAHAHERLGDLAHPDRFNGRLDEGQWQRSEETDADRPSETLSDTDGECLRHESERHQQDAAECVDAVARDDGFVRTSAAGVVSDTCGTRREGRELGSACEGERHGPEAFGSAPEFRCAYDVRPFPPRPNELDEWRRVLEQDPSVEPAIRRMADVMAARMDRLRCTGNGVDPIPAAVAIVSLWLELVSG